VEMKAFALDCVVELTPADQDPNVQCRMNLSSTPSTFFILGDIYIYLDNYIASTYCPPVI
jgi:hypothetical protein